jgi:hypothetical protein
VTSKSCSSGPTSQAPRGQAQRAPLAAPKKFDPEPYTSAQAVDPFSNQKLTVALKQEVAAAQFRCWPSELNRRKEPLEAYPLDSMSMVGSFAKRRAPFALLRVDNLLYQVKVGDYLGQNYGRITKHRRDRPGAARGGAGRRRRMDRTDQHPAAAGEGAMRKTQEMAKMVRKWRTLPAGAAGARHDAVRTAGSLGAERDPVDHQHPAGRAPRWCASNWPRPWPPCRPASRCRRRRAWRSTCPASATRWVATVVEINQGNLRRSAWRRPPTARAWC